jgi:predicted nucleic acid-binding protein
MIFLDTSLFVALVRRRARRHAEAVQLWEQHARTPLVTSTGVVGEIWTLLRRRDSHADAVRAVTSLRASRRITVVNPDAALVSDAWSWLQHRDEHPYSFVDSLSFSIMRNRRITDALAFDDDFTRAGFVELRPSATAG